MNIATNHILSFDIEHWYESYLHRNISGWENLTARDHIIVRQIIELLGKCGHKGTFFFTGRFAREFPDIVKECFENGHEIASHSDKHVVINRLSGRAEFQKDLQESIKILSDITSKKILGYRAPKWSIDKQNESWVFETLIEEGLVYDSSYFPFYNADRMRKKGIPLIVQDHAGREIIEVPASGLGIGPWTFPVAGGLYFRAFPLPVIEFMLKQKESENQRGMLYLHPYDLDPGQHKIDGGGILLRLFRTYGIVGAWKKLERIMNNYNFTSIEKILPSLTIDTRLVLEKKDE